MENTTTAPSVQRVSVNVIYIAIADKVRTDTQALEKPIHIESLAALFPDMKPEEIVGHVTEMVKVERYRDIQIYLSPSGAAYLYSNHFLLAVEAAEKIRSEETQTKIAVKVREDSEQKIRLTPVSTLAEMFPDIEPAQVEQYANALLENLDQPDIRRVIGPTGLAYLYSVNHMTETYARLLARVEARDPLAMIAETVREESRVYPRPTKVTLFFEDVFELEACKIEEHLDALLQSEKYRDIKKIIAPNGAVYLYSETFMHPAMAEHWVRWEEIEKANNP